MISKNAKHLVYLIMKDCASPLFSMDEERGMHYWRGMLESYIDRTTANESMRYFDGMVFNNDGVVAFVERTAGKELHSNVEECSMFDENEDEFRWDDYFPSDIGSFTLTIEEAEYIKTLLSI